MYYIYKKILGYDPGHGPGGPGPISAPDGAQIKDTSKVRAPVASDSAFRRGKEGAGTRARICSWHAASVADDEWRVVWPAAGRPGACVVHVACHACVK
jgi:hypothetical protein